MNLTLKRDVVKLGRDIIPLRTIEKIPKWIPKITTKVLKDRVNVAKIIKTIQQKAIARGQRKPTDYQSLTDYVRKLTGASPAKVSRYLRKLPQWRAKDIAYDKRKNVHLRISDNMICIFKRSTLNTPEGKAYSLAKQAVRDTHNAGKLENKGQITVMDDNANRYKKKYGKDCYYDETEIDTEREEGMWYH